ncbi:MAG TPA: biotin/lipoyl-binding protein [Pyrinomonadaceae bacterium]|nr:biotin/lipoyl-binding protein [Pyrinomonadaceae bacterium]
MKLRARVADEEHEVEIDRKGSELWASVNGREYLLEVSEPEPNVFLIRHQGNVAEFYVNPTKRPGDPQTVSSRFADIEVTVFDPRDLRSTAGRSDSAHGLAEIRTAMPGKIVRMLCEVGSEVTKGDGVLVVEAMKMQNDLKAPRSGIIREIRVSKGQTVKAGEILAVIE